MRRCRQKICNCITLCRCSPFLTVITIIYHLNMSDPHGICLDFRPSNGLHIAGPAVQGACMSRRRGVWDNPTQRPCRHRQVSHLTSTAHHNIHRYILLSTIMGQSRLDIHTMEALGCRHTRRATLPRVNLNCGRRLTHKKKTLPAPLIIKVLQALFRS